MMENRADILETLSGLRRNFRPGRFYLPDNSVPVADMRSTQPCYRLLFLLNGEKNEPMAFQGVERRVRLLPGDCWLFGKSVQEAVSFRDDHEFLCIVPHAAYLRIAHYRITAGTPHAPWPEHDWFHTRLPETVLKAFELLEELARQGKIDLCPAILELILTLTEEQVRQGAATNRKSNRTYEEVRNYIERHFREPLTRSQAARYFELTPTHISRLFRQYADGSFQDYLAECRLSAAKHLLIHSSLPLKEIADRSGFGGEIRFIRRFRELTGITPGQYRLRAGTDTESHTVS